MKRNDEYSVDKQRDAFDCTFEEARDYVEKNYKELTKVKNRKARNGDPCTEWWDSNGRPGYCSAGYNHTAKLLVVDVHYIKERRRKRKSREKKKAEDALIPRDIGGGRVKYEGQRLIFIQEEKYTLPSKPRLRFGTIKKIHDDHIVVSDDETKREFKIFVDGERKLDVFTLGIKY
jgi:hypothetical protein